MNGDINAIVASDSAVFVGGYFGTINNQTRSRIAAFDIESGGLLPWAPAVDGIVSAIYVSDGVVYVGGGFETVSGVERARFAALSLETGDVLPLQVPLDIEGSVHAIKQRGSTLWVAGDFYEDSYSVRRPLVALGLETGLLRDWPAAPEGGTILGLALGEDRVFAAGQFEGLGEKYSDALAAFDMATGERIAWAPNVNGLGYCIGLAGDLVWFGGSTGIANGDARPGVAAIDIESGALLPRRPELRGEVARIAVSGSKVFTAGYFYGVEDSGRFAGILLLDAESGAILPNRLPCEESISAIFSAGDFVYVGGTFHEIGGVPRNGLAQIRSSDGTVTGWNPNVRGGAVESMQLAGDTLYIAGNSRRSATRFDIIAPQST